MWIYLIIGIFVCIFRRFIFSLPQLVRYKIKDLKNFNKDYFKLYGLRVYTGRQGAGKTIGLVYDLERYRKRYPKAKIYTNFGYKYETAPLNSLNDLLDPALKNGTDGVIFAIDEIQNEFSCANSKDFPETLLSQVTQQRKQRVCILATSQVFTRVAKPLREQCFIVVVCQTLFSRYTRLKYYDADAYIEYADNPSRDKRRKLRKKDYQSFVQTDSLRDLYNSYLLIERLSRVGFAPKQQVINTTNILVSNAKGKR